MRKQMKEDYEERKTAIQWRIVWRIVATLILLLISLATFYFGSLELDRQLVAEIVAGLLVLATAGIWVSYLAEEEARRTVVATAAEIRQATELSRACVQIGLLHIFSSSDEQEYHQFISDQLLRAHRNSEIRVIGVACRGFFHADGGPNNLQIKSLAVREVPMRVILSHPFFEPAITRAIREDRNRKHLSDYLDSILLTDVLLSCDGIIGLDRKSIQARLCPVTTGCRATFIGDLLILEPLHFGSENQRASLETPVLVFRKNTPFARRFSDHFEFLWSISSQFEVSPDLIRTLRPKNARIEEQAHLLEYMRMCRPDLFAVEGTPTPSDEKT
jgi:hypothetical protein